MRLGVGGARRTETVYGLAANALDGEAVKKIFLAKGRPQDNPLIVHIADFDQIYDLCPSVPPQAKQLAEAFWPGPMTMIVPKGGCIPDAVSCGLDTVGIRLPSHAMARALIRESGVPLAAPSANTSGRPSTTTAAHVMRDMDGKAFGQMVVQLPEDQEICARMLGFMEARGLAMWEIPPGSCIDCDPEDYDYEQERGRHA